MDFPINKQNKNYPIYEINNYKIQNERYYIEKDINFTSGNDKNEKYKLKNKKEKKKIFKNKKQMKYKEKSNINYYENIKENNSNLSKRNNYIIKEIKNNKEENKNINDEEKNSKENENEESLKKSINNNLNKEQKNILNNIEKNNYSNINLLGNGNINYKEINRNINNENFNNLYIKNFNEVKNSFKNDNAIYQNKMYDTIFYSKIKNKNNKENKFINYNLPIENCNLINFVEENINKINFQKSKEKKYILMSDILKKAPLKLNPRSKPFIINNINKKENNFEDKVILNLKVKIPNEKNDLIIPLRKNDNSFTLLNILKEKVLDRNQFNIIFNEVQNAINLIQNFSHFIIMKNSIDSMNKIYNFIHN